MERAPQEPYGQNLMFTRLGLANLEDLVRHFEQFNAEDLMNRFQQSFDSPDKALRLRNFLTSLLIVAKDCETVGWFGAQDASGELVVVTVCDLADHETLVPSMSIVPRLRRTGAHAAAWSWVVEFARRLGMKFIEGSFLASNEVVRKGLERFGIHYTIFGNIGHYRFEVKSEADYVRSVLDNLQRLFVANDDMQARLPQPAHSRN